MRTKRNFYPKFLFFKLAALALALLALASCAGQEPATNYAASDAQIARDLAEIPQNPFYFAYKDGAEAARSPLLSKPGQEELAAQAVERFFSPWVQSAPAGSLAEAMWGYYQLKPENGYMENLRPYSPERWASLAENADPLGYPNRALPAVTVDSADLRLMPTSTPYFFSPDKPGQGYPFDYYQNSRVPLGTPLFISHLSKDGLWALVETPSAGGWVAVDKLALVDTKFVIAWKSLPLGAILRENTPLAAWSEPGKLGLPLAPRLVSLGTLLPMQPFPREFGKIPAGMRAVYYPVKGPDGYASLEKALLPESSLAAWPLPLSREHLAGMIAQMLGQPYGWGGYGGNRDCSATLRDLFLPFGVWLPRNSKAQSETGLGFDLEELAPTDKEASILHAGVPFLSLVGLPGHIMLYLGEYQGRAAVFHNLWGLRVLRPGSKTPGRAVIGKAVITSLTPGRERKDIAQPNSILDAVNKLSFPLLPKE